MKKVLTATAMMVGLAASGQSVSMGETQEKAPIRSKDPLTKKQKIRRSRTKAQKKARKLHRK